MDNNNNVSVKRQKCNNNHDSFKNEKNNNLDTNNHDLDNSYMIKIDQDNLNSLNPPLVHRQKATLYTN